MKRLVYVWLSGVMIAMMLASAAQSQDDKLAEHARQRRKEKQAQGEKKVYDNDNLPRQEHISVVGSERASSSTDATRSAEASGSASSKAGGPKPDQVKEDGATGGKDPQDKARPERTSTDASDDRQKVTDEWQKKIADKQSALDLLQRELDVLQREYRLRAAAMYADVGNRLRNSAQWDKDEKQYKAQIDAKQKAVEAAKQQLENTREQARKAGIPAKARE